MDAAIVMIQSRGLFAHFIDDTNESHVKHARFAPSMTAQMNLQYCFEPCVAPLRALEFIICGQRRDAIFSFQNVNRWD